MAQFQASLLNDSGQYDIVLDSTGKFLVLGEHSNYADSTEVGVTESYFTLFRKIIVTDHAGVDYVFSSIGDGDVDIDPGIDFGSPSGESFDYPLYDDNDAYKGDGVVKVRLITLPTWNSLVAYTTAGNPDLYVARDVSGTVRYFKLLQDSTNEPPEDTPSSWEEILDITTIGSRFNVVGYASVILNIQKVFVLSTNKAASEELTGNFDELSRNENYVIAAKLNLAIKAITFRSQAGQWDKAAWLITEATKIADNFNG